VPVAILRRCRISEAARLAERAQTRKGSAAREYAEELAALLAPRVLRTWTMFEHG